MFGIDDMLLLSMAGGGLLGAASSKNPMQGALLGAGLGAAGSQFIPGLLGSSAPAASAAASPASAAAMAGDTVNLGNSAQMMSGAANGNMAIASTPMNPGAMDSIKSGIREYGPLVDAANTGIKTAQALNPPQQQMNFPPVPAIGGNPVLSNSAGQTLGSIANQGIQNQQAILNNDYQSRMQRRMYRRGV